MRVALSRALLCSIGILMLKLEGLHKGEILMLASVALPLRRLVHHESWYQFIIRRVGWLQNLPVSENSWYKVREP
jgi:hypothetical protein